MGGYVATDRVRQTGFSAGLIERTHLGGTCVNRGCNSTKVLLKWRYAQRPVAEMAPDAVARSMQNIPAWVARLNLHSRARIRSDP